MSNVMVNSFSRSCVTNINYPVAFIFTQTNFGTKNTIFSVGNGTLFHEILIFSHFLTKKVPDNTDRSQIKVETLK